jgi:hypothetical protein
LRVRVDLRDDFVHMALAGQAGAQVEKLADALRRREPHRPAEEPPVGPGHVLFSGEKLNSFSTASRSAAKLSLPPSA